MLSSIFGTESKCPPTPVTESDVPATPPTSPVHSVQPDTNVASHEIPYLVGAIHDLLDLGSKLENLFDAMPQDQLGPSLRVVVQELYDAYTEVFGDPDEPDEQEDTSEQEPAVLVRQNAMVPRPGPIRSPSTPLAHGSRQLRSVPECKSPTRRPNTTRQRPVMLE